MVVEHTEQTFPSDIPDSVHVAGLPRMVFSVCAAFAVGVCSRMTVEQTEHFFPSVRPEEVHVEAMPGRITSV